MESHENIKQTECKCAAEVIKALIEKDHYMFLVTDSNNKTDTDGTAKMVASAVKIIRESLQIEPPSGGTF